MKIINVLTFIIVFSLTKTNDIGQSKDTMARSTVFIPFYPIDRYDFFKETEF